MIESAMYKFSRSPVVASPACRKQCTLLYPNKAFDMLQNLQQARASLAAAAAPAHGEASVTVACGYPMQGLADYPV